MSSDKLREIVILVDNGASFEEQPAEKDNKRSTPVRSRLVKGPIGCQGEKCKGKGCRSIECPLNSWDIDNLNDRLEKEVLPSVFARFSEDQFADFDTLNFKAKLQNTVNRFLKSIDEKADAIVKKRKVDLDLRYQNDLQKIGKRYKVVQCQVCLESEPHITCRDLACGHLICHGCAQPPLAKLKAPTTENDFLFFELKCPTCKRLSKWDVPIEDEEEELRERVREDERVARNLQDEFDEVADEDEEFVPVASPGYSPTSPI